MHLGPEERDLLRRLTTELEELLSAEPGPSLRRLRPRAYEDEQVGGGTALSWGPSWKRFALENLRGLEETAGLPTVSTWGRARPLARRAQHGLRLVLGTRLDVGEDGFADRFDPNAPHA